MGAIIRPAFMGSIIRSGLFNKTDLIGWWSLDETSSNRADSHGSNTLADNNTVLYQAGKVGNAADFEASASEYLSISDNAALSTGDVDFTFGCWMQTESQGGNMAIACKANTASVREWFLLYLLASDRLQFKISDSGGSDVGAVLADTYGAVPNATWAFVLGWHDSVNNLVGIQVNNGTANTSATSGVPSDSAAQFSIGAYGTTPALPFDGLIDEAFFFKRLLTDDEKTWLYNSGNGRSYSEL